MESRLHKTFDDALAESDCPFSDQDDALLESIRSHCDGTTGLILMERARATEVGLLIDSEKHKRKAQTPLRGGLKSKTQEIPETSNQTNLGIEDVEYRAVVG